MEKTPGTHPWLRFYDPHVPAHLDYPRAPLYTLLQDTAAQHPNRPCARFFGRSFTYRQVDEWASRFAAGLRSLGVRPGDRVMLLLPNSPPFLIAYFGALKAGAVVVPLNPLSSPRELAFFIANPGAGTVVTIPLFAEKVHRLRQASSLPRLIVARLADFLPFPLNILMALREWRSLRRIPASHRIDLRQLLQFPLPPGFQPHPSAPDDLALILYSGGTTGTSKGIMLSHFSCLANACQLRAWGNLHPDQRVLAVLPLFHGFGMSVTMNTALLVGGEMILHPRFIVKDVLASIQKDRPSFFIGVPTMFVALLNHPNLERFDLTSLDGILVGAAPLTRAVKDAFERRTGGRMIEGYGLTEAVTAIMGNPFHGLHKPGSVGLPFPDVEAKIVNLDDGRDLPPGETGEIVLRSPTLMLGYYQNPDETSRTIMDGWLHTGDIGTMDDDGYFYITDRKKELIISGGFNVFPREIHEVLYAHPQVLEAVVVGLPDPYLGERIKAFVVLKPGESASPQELIAYCKERLTYYKVPSEVEFRSELPKSMIGKILPRMLQEEEAHKARQAG